MQALDINSEDQLALVAKLFFEKVGYLILIKCPKYINFFFDGVYRFRQLIMIRYALCMQK